jgi:hypothetical protein
MLLLFATLGFKIIQLPAPQKKIPLAIRARPHIHCTIIVWFALFIFKHINHFFHFFIFFLVFGNLIFIELSLRLRLLIMALSFLVKDGVFPLEVIELF